MSDATRSPSRRFDVLRPACYEVGAQTNTPVPSLSISVLPDRPQGSLGTQFSLESNASPTSGQSYGDWRERRTSDGGQHE